MKSESYLSCLEVLASLRVSAFGAAGDMLWIHFGDLRTVPTRNGGTKQVGEWALHLQCPWRYLRSDSLVVGSRDFYYRASDGERIAGDSDESIFARKAPSIDRYFADTVVRVVSVVDRKAGAFDLSLDDGSVLSVMPVESKEVADAESWRFFRPSRNGHHFVYPMEEQTAEPGATDNPDDAQRVRED